MPGKDYFRNLARMSRRIAGNMTDPVIVEQLLLIGEEYDLEAERAPDADPSEHMPGATRRSRDGKFS